MTATAFLFAGQGVDILPSALAFAGASSRLSALLDRAAQVGGTDRRSLFGRGGRELASTRRAQPALVALSLGVFEELADRGVHPQYAAGHSLGELSAWSALGAISTEDAIDLAGERGRLMAREAERNPGGMLALVGATERSAGEAVELGRERGSVVLAARNAVDEWVLSGEEAALAAVASRHRATRIRTQGAWHSPAMAGAVRELEVALLASPRERMNGHLVFNRTGEIVEREDEIPSLLAEQLAASIDWVAVLETLRDEGVRRFVTVGPGKILRGLLRKRFGADVCVLSTETPRELDRTIEMLKR